MTSPATSSDRNDATAHPDGSAWLARLEREGATLGDALALFDAMPAVAVSEIMGRWRGSELPTGHPLDGWLLAVGWWGKEFSSPEHVHPLLFTNGKDHVFPASARAFPFRPLMAFVMNNKLRPNRLVCSIVRAALPLFRTQRRWPGSAPSRPVEYRRRRWSTTGYRSMTRSGASTPRRCSE